MGKLFIFDLDGTLLKDDKTMSEITAKALIDLVKKDNNIIFATARAPRDVYNYIPNVLSNSPIICYNGACIIQEEKFLYKREILKDDTLNIIKIAEQYNHKQICLEINNKLYSNFDTARFFGNVPTRITDLVKLNFQTAYKVIICDKKGIDSRIVNKLPNSCKGVITDKGELCQVMNKCASKWNGVEFLIKQLNINYSDIIAFGDDYNDIDMIKNSSIGIAMGNADIKIKSVADVIIDSNINDGVAKYLISTYL